MSLLPPRDPQLDLANRRFGRLQVISWAGREKRVHMWACQCECGRLVLVRTSNLMGGNTRNCGCLKEAVDGSGPERSHVLNGLVTLAQRDAASLTRAFIAMLR